MFITCKRSGYTRDGQQFCSGLFLILTQPKYDSAKYPSHLDRCYDCGKTSAEHDVPLAPDVQVVSDRMHRAWKHLFNERITTNDKQLREEHLFDACEIILNAKHKVEGCRYFRPSGIDYPIRAIVRHVSMSQCGQFMMGFARVKGNRLTLSGSYGSDGLPDSVPDVVYEQGLELPQVLRDAWNIGGGWNSAGNEADAMRQWALHNLAKLRA